MKKGIEDVNNIPAIIREILKKRGVKESEFVEYFSFAPKLAYDPFLLANMRAGVDLLLKAIDGGKRIVVYGDYDVDGITSTSLLMKVLGELTDNLTYYIPTRKDEGYGLHIESIDKIKKDGGEFIVTVDCGSVSKEETAYAHSIGIETLVTDHHSISKIRAEGLIINPHLQEDEYPFKDLAGVGVAYKLALAISKEREISKDIMSEIVELVAIGTIADIMPLVDENRTIVKYGLRFMHLGCQNKGLKRLIELSGLDYKTLKVSDISYGIAPKINASGRLGDAKLGVKLFLADNEKDIERYCNQLIEINGQRKAYQDNAYEKSLKMIDEELANGDFVILEINDSHEGVLGIVAGKIKEIINRPVVVVSQNGDTYRGTGRSINNVNLFEMLDKYRDEFVSFGGHSAACGFTISSEKVAKLKKDLNSDIGEMLSQDEHLFDINYEYDIDAEMNKIDIELAKTIESMEPCGRGNELPVFRINNVEVENWKFLKDGEKYARFSIKKDNELMECITFNNASKAKETIENSEKVDVLARLEINSWNDRERLQLVVNHVLPEGELD